MSKEIRNNLLIILICGALLAGAAAADRVFDLPLWGSLLLYLVPYFIAGGEVIAEAAEGIKEGGIFNENLLMTAATAGALAIGFLPGAEPQYAEAVFVMLFFRVGELFESIAEGRSERSIAALTGLRPDSAVVIRNGNEIVVSPENVEIGEVIVVRPGERVPLDGTVIEGESALNMAVITGESVPCTVVPGSTAVSGGVNINGVLKIEVTKPYGDSTVERILELVKNAGENKSRNEAFITRFARVYTPAVVGAAVLLALLPPIISGDFAGNIAKWLYRALTFLIVSCPCALVISVPLAFFGGIGGASKKGVLIKGSAFVEALANAGTVVLDKTGTLTEGVFEVADINSISLEKTELLHLAAHAEQYSNHPIAASLREANEASACECTVSEVKEFAGKGVCARVNGELVKAGTAEFAGAGDVPDAPGSGGTEVFVSVNGEYAGRITLSDRIKPDSQAALEQFERLGVGEIIMLTGDGECPARFTAEKLGINKYYARLNPEQKAEKLKQILNEKEKGKTVIFAGDGVNDAPVLALADAGAAMGALGSDAAIEAADVVLMDDNLTKLAEAVGICRRTLRIARENIAVSLIVKACVLVPAAFGLAPMWLAVFADVGVTVLAVINSMRTLK